MCAHAFAAAGQNRPGDSPKSLLADAQFVLARELGFEIWAKLKRHFEGTWPARLEPCQRFADDLVAVFDTGDAGALARLHETLGRSPSAEQLRAHALQRLRDVPGRSAGDGRFSTADARL